MEKMARSLYEARMEKAKSDLEAALTYAKTLHGDRRIAAAVRRAADAYDMAWSAALREYTMTTGHRLTA